MSLSNDVFSDLGGLTQLMDKPVYVLRAGLESPGASGEYYRIYPVELKVSEIRLGNASKGLDDSFYGPGDISLLCQHEKGFVQAFSPVDGELVAATTLAGRNTRAFFDKKDLMVEAEIIRENIWKTYKNVRGVSIAFPKGFWKDEQHSLHATLADAVERSGGAGSAKECFSGIGMD